MSVNRTILKKDPSLTELAETGSNDQEYQRILIALKERKKMEELETIHPAREVASIWNELSVEQTDRGELAVLDVTRLRVPREASKDLSFELF